MHIEIVNLLWSKKKAILISEMVEATTVDRLERIIVPPDNIQQHSRPSHDDCAFVHFFSAATHSFKREKSSPVASTHVPDLRIFEEADLAPPWMSDLAF
ncbi:MAG TPA: hypothetical protein VH592_23675 [Gemmataceae bacterium]|jgi:hypothetical protein